MGQKRLILKDESEEPAVDPRNALNELNAKEWIKSTVSIWYQRGLGKGHPDTKIERQHPAPFAFRMVERLLNFFTKKGDSVLDPFSGVGSTLKACALNGRSGVGVELTEEWVRLTEERLRTETPDQRDQVVMQGDARVVMKDFEDESFDFIVTSPPYWGILNKPADHRVKSQRLAEDLPVRYSDDPRDLANITEYQSFLTELRGVFKDCYRVLMTGKYIAVVVADFRHKKRYYHYHSDVAGIMEEVGFLPKGDIIYVKNAKRLYPYGYPFDYVPNIHHEYIMIFRKDRGEAGLGNNGR